MDVCKCAYLESFNQKLIWVVSARAFFKTIFLDRNLFVCKRIVRKASIKKV